MHGMIIRGARLCIAATLLFLGNAVGQSPLDGSLSALRSAVADLSERYPESYVEGAAFIARIAAFEELARKRPLAAGDMRRFAELQREALVAHPLLKHRSILFTTRRQFKPDHHNTATMFQAGEINTQSFEGGSALKALDLAQGGVHVLLEAPEGIVRDPEVHFEGDRILISMRRDISGAYHLYEIGADGANLRQLTFAEGVSDIDPFYLPNGDIVFSSTREPKYCMCNRHIMCNLFRMSADGANIHQIGKSTLFEGHGALLPDGRILYYRWEYVDRNFGDAQGLWTTYPDGTNHAVYWGNNTQSPGAVINARPIPGTSQAICVFSSCHDRPWGAIAIIDRRLGVDGAVDGQPSDSVIRTWPPSAVALVGEGDPGQFHWDSFMSVTPKYEDPFPLDKHFFLCVRTIGAAETTGIYMLDVFGNELLLYAEEDGASGVGCYDPMPLAPSKRPPDLPVRRDYENGWGCFYVADVYQGTHMEGVERGSVKYLRVVESPEKRTFTHPSWDGQGQQAPGMSWHDFNNKRILGVVPVEADGSAYFQAPSDAFLYFQLLDERGMMVQSMRSGATIQSGEVQGCLGCHEDRLSTPPLPATATIQALTRPPSELTGWLGPARLFDYQREVQPVFDAHCVRCHDYGKEAGAALNLAGDRDLVFNTSYNELWRKGYVQVVGAGPAQIQQAFSWGSHASKLTRTLLEAHYDAAPSAEDIERVVTWMDINAPYYSEYDSAYPDHPGGRSPLDREQALELSVLTGVPLLEQLGQSVNQGPQVCFERPEMSPCLNGLETANPEARQRALEIIKAGARRLETQARADMDGFQPCAEHAAQQEKYRLRQEVEARNREALRQGEILYDAK